jgi:hypothetical protein
MVHSQADRHHGEAAEMGGHGHDAAPSREGCLEAFGPLDGNRLPTRARGLVRHRQRRIQHAAIQVATRGPHDRPPLGASLEALGHDEREVGFHAPGAPALQQECETPDGLPDRLEPALRNAGQNP